MRRILFPLLLILFVMPSAEAKPALIMPRQKNVSEADLLLVPILQATPPVRVAFWNVENFFYPADDSLSTYDDAYTPQGELHWSWRRFRQKRDVIYKTLVAMELPAVVGLAEVEDSNVLNQLCLATPLRRIPYRYIHFDSPDPRGIDCALLYRLDGFFPFQMQPIRVSDSSTGFFTRDILLVGGVLARGDTLFVLVNHWPSKLGGADADIRREHIASRVTLTADSLLLSHPSARVVVMGDFNEQLAVGDGDGSYCFHGAWNWIDHIFVYSTSCPPKTLSPVTFSNQHTSCRAFNEPWLLEADEAYGGEKPSRTYAGPRYLGGVSDHLPVFLDLDN